MCYSVQDEVLIAGFGRRGHAVGDIPGVRFKVSSKVVPARASMPYMSLTVDDIICGTCSVRCPLVIFHSQHVLATPHDNHVVCLHKA